MITGQKMVYEAHTFRRLARPPPINSIVAARDEQEHFFRAIVLSRPNEEGGVYVEFLDFGNTAVAYEFRELPEDLFKLPALAIRCRLANDSKMIWTAQKVDRFHNLCLSQDWFDIRVVDMEERFLTVQLYLNGRSIDEIVEEEFRARPLQMVLYQPVFPVMPPFVTNNEQQQQYH